MKREADAYITYQIIASQLGEVSKELADIFEELAHNEKEHYKIWAKLMFDDEYFNIESSLFDAIDAELAECSELYGDFSRIAQEEGFSEIAEKFEMVRQIECQHAEIIKKVFSQYIDIINKDDVSTQGFVCSNCGYIHKYPQKPLVCPVCEHPRKYFKEVKE